MTTARRLVPICILTLILGLAIPVPADVQLRTSDGILVSGQLLDISSTQVVVETAAGSQKFDLSSISAVVASPPPNTDPAKLNTARVELNDGSIAVIQSLAIDSESAKVSLDGQATVQIPVSKIRAVRFRDQEGDLAKQWQAIQRAARTADALVIRKINMVSDVQGNEKRMAALDYLEGIVRGVSKQSVKFEFEGDVLDVKLEKVDGILFLRGKDTGTPSPLCRVSDRRGSKWNVRSISMRDGLLQMNTVSNIPFQLSLDQIVQLDFSSANTIYLSDLDPDEVEWVDFSDRLVEILPALRKRYEPKWIREGSDFPLVLGGNRYERGLVMYPVSRVLYRLPDEVSFNRLRATLGIDDQSQGRGDVGLTIYGDSRELLTRTFSPSESQPWELDLDLSGIRRLEFRVITGSRLVQYSRLNLCELRITK